MNKILDKACEDGDLTPEGVSKAKEDIGDIDTGGLAVPVKFETGKSPSLKSYIFAPAKVPGGAKSLATCIRATTPPASPGRLGNARGLFLGPPVGHLQVGPGRDLARD